MKLVFDNPSFSLDALESVARCVTELAKGIPVVLLKGEMGAGKTTFSKAFCKALGVKETVSSPTFSIVNEYFSENGPSIYHFDLYRLDDQEEAEDIGILDYLYSGNTCIIEWPEIIDSLLPDQFLEIHLQTTSSVLHRSINVYQHG